VVPCGALSCSEFYRVLQCLLESVFQGELRFCRVAECCGVWCILLQCLMQCAVACVVSVLQ